MIPVISLGPLNLALALVAVPLLNAWDRLRAPCAPFRMHLNCPRCEASHIDAREWAVRAHSTHLCLFCGWTWKPWPFPTVGVQR